MADRSDIVVAIDLDDTLYPERDYVRSGIRAVCNEVERLFGQDESRIAAAALEAEQDDWLERLCGALPAGGLTKESLLWTYRLHEPTISLSDEVRHALSVLTETTRGVAIVTDGRSMTQRLKLKALGLSAIKAYISDEYGGAFKPDPTRFLALMGDFPAARYAYVADNVDKDFVAPNQLGWLTIGLGSTRAAPSPHHAPRHWVSSLGQALAFLC